MYRSNFLQNPYFNTQFTLLEDLGNSPFLLWTHNYLLHFFDIFFWHLYLTFLEWHTLSKAAWYTYGTLLGEAITRDTKSGRSKALRIAIATWILYCLIISQGYGGSLKAYLSTPAFSNPIDTLQQVSSNFWTRVL